MYTSCIIYSYTVYSTLNFIASSKKENSWFEINSDELREEVLGFVLDNVKISKVLKEVGYALKIS